MGGFFLNKAVKNHLLGDTIIFLFAITISFAITTVLKINAQNHYIVVFLLAMLFIFIGEKLIRKYFPHFLRDSKEISFESIIITVILFFLGDFISDKTNIWLIITLYYVIYVVFTIVFERVTLGKK